MYKNLNRNVPMREGSQNVDGSPLSVVGLRRKRCPVTLDCDSMVSIPAISYAQNVPLLLCHELFNESSLPDVCSCLSRCSLAKQLVPTQKNFVKVNQGEYKLVYTYIYCNTQCIFAYLRIEAMKTFL